MDGLLGKGSGMVQARDDDGVSALAQDFNAPLLSPDDHCHALPSRSEFYQVQQLVLDLVIINVNNDVIVFISAHERVVEVFGCIDQSKLVRRGGIIDNLAIFLLHYDRMAHS